ncbi:MAG: hypothetical protein EBU26_13240 [Verrucomicrobia bacterium]|nr:hypothetical protein [Verrucomicrobiota bacterium]
MRLLLFMVWIAAGHAMPVMVAEAWPQWRGPMATGQAPDANPPIDWSESKNLAWKVPLPGQGHATPIVWDHQVFLAMAIPTGPQRTPVYNQAEGAHDNLPVTQDHAYAILSYDRHSGRQQWQTTLATAFPHEGGHDTGSLASASPVTDGEHLVAFFGSRGLHGMDMEGKLCWSRDFGTMQTRHAHGEGASPALHGRYCVVNWDHEGDSMVYALDKATGTTIWSRPRDESTSWSTPLILEHAGRHQVIIAATGRIRSYDLETGQELWQCGGLSRNVVASPVAGHGLVVAANSYDWQAMLAIRLEGAKGDITGSEQVVWSLNRLTPYVPSPLLVGQKLFFLRHLQGILSCVDIRTGETAGGPWRLPLVRMVFASPVAAGGRLYVVSREGITLVFDHQQGLNLLSANHLDDQFSASPAVVGDSLLLRGDRYLYCLKAASQESSVREPSSSPTGSAP